MNEQEDYSNLKNSMAVLNDKFTFQNFIIGNSNKFAVDKALELVYNLKQQNKLYNPFIIYGKGGLGKTHLLNAITNRIIKRYTYKVLCISGKQFINDYETMTPKCFKNKYYELDILSLDDLQDILNTKSKSLHNELLALIKYLYNNNKQMIFTSNKSIKEYNIETLSLGLELNLPSPDLRTRQDIVEKNINKSLYSKYDISGIIDLIAVSYRNNINELLSAINKLEDYAKTNKYKIEFDNVQSILEEY